MLDQNTRDLMATIADLDRRLQIQERNENQIWKGSAFPTTGLYDRRKYTIATATSHEEYFYDLANNRWLSTVARPMSVISNNGVGFLILNASLATSHNTPRPDETADIYVTKLIFNTYMYGGGTYDATNRWDIVLKRQDSAAAANTIGTQSNFQTGYVTARRYTHSLVVNTQYTLAQSLYFYTDINKIGAAGQVAIDAPMYLFYRLVG